MQPAATRSDRSSILQPVPAPSVTYLQQYQPRRILYGPVTTLQTYTRTLQPSYIYSGAQRNIGLSNVVQNEDKSNAWQMKIKLLESQYCQQQFVHPPNPMVIYKQSANSYFPHPVHHPSSTSFLVSSSSFVPGPFSGEHYNHSNITVIPQTYFKPPELQNVCLLQDRLVLPHNQQLHQVKPYYVTATGTSNLQTMNVSSSFQPLNLQSYPTANMYAANQAAVAQNASIISNPPLELIVNEPTHEKPSSSSEMTYKCNKNNLQTSAAKTSSLSFSDYNNDWPTYTGKMSSNTVYDFSLNDRYHNVSTISSQMTSDSKEQDERLSETSSTSFDFTVEAEKMVSALCDVKSSNEFAKENAYKQKENVDEKVKCRDTWFTNFCDDFGVSDNCSSRTTATQTQEQCLRQKQYSELIRKTVYWGCTEAETILKSSRYYQDPKYEWLANLSVATKVAITKSSNCFPVFGGDQIFVQDLINALLRISNGWLVLDNYLNKQYYPTLSDKFDNELVRSFQTWETSTYDLLKKLVQTFMRLKKNSSEVGQKPLTCGSSFPGDVSMYTNYDLFDPLLLNCFHQRGDVVTDAMMSNQQSQYKLNCLSQTSDLQNSYLNTQSNQKESKLRSRWTISENVPSANDDNNPTSEPSAENTENSFHCRKSRNKCISTVKVNATSKQSLNAEFFQLQNKILQSEIDKYHDFQEKASNFFDKSPSNVNVLKNSCERNKIQKPVPQNPILTTKESVYFGNTAFASLQNQANRKSGLEMKSMSSNSTKSTSVNESLYIGKSVTNKIELVPKNKMTLLSQIEPSSSTINADKQKMTANLTAWFASMRNVNQLSNLEMKSMEGVVKPMLPTRVQDISRNAMNLARHFKMDVNQQLISLKNMQSIQSAPWNASNLLNNSQMNTCHNLDECDSSEDVRVYMKPGSYNVPKKRHQKRSNRRTDYSSVSRNSSRSSKWTRCYDAKEPTSSSFVPTTSSNLSPFSTRMRDIDISLLQSSGQVSQPTEPMKTSRKNLQTSNSARDKNKDVTWKAACQSAEILLEALTVKNNKRAEHSCEIYKDKEIEYISQNSSQLTNTENQTRQSVGNSNSGNTSNYEASEDDSGSTGKMSSKANYAGLYYEKKGKHQKGNVKTDSWLMKTLSNINKAERQDNPKSSGPESSDSLNSSIQEDDQTCANIQIGKEAGDIQSEHNLAQKCENRTTYSEVIRRSITNTSSLDKQKKARSLTRSSSEMLLSRRHQYADDAKSFKPFKSTVRKTTRYPGQTVKNETKVSKSKLCQNSATTSCFKTDKYTSKINHGEQKEKLEKRELTIERKEKTKNKDIAACSTRRKQCLSPSTRSKLQAIHEAVWQMEEAYVFKYPSAKISNPLSSLTMMKEYCKVVKGPIFLETIEYKLKNHIYNSVENALDDFRQIVNNSKLYYKNDDVIVLKIEILSKKLEELFEESFSTYFFQNASKNVSDKDASMKKDKQRDKTRECCNAQTKTS